MVDSSPHLWLNQIKPAIDPYPFLYQVKPSSNQVNLASCCVMPPDLTAFAKEFDIQLLTHNDPKGETEFCVLCDLDVNSLLTDYRCSNASVLSAKSNIKLNVL